MAQTKQKNEIPQIDKALVVLSDMARNITEDDRKAAVERKLGSTGTVSRYLTKDVKAKNLDTAVKLIEFFNERIAEREQLISSAASKRATA